MSCETGIILAGRDFIRSATQQDIFNLSGILLGECVLLAYSFSGSPDSAGSGAVSAAARG